MLRLAAYLADLAKLYGHEGSVHFDRLEEGSVAVVAYVDEAAYEAVQARLMEVSSGNPSVDALRAFNETDAKLRGDNAVCRVVKVFSGNIVRFPGRKPPTPVQYGVFNEAVTLEGVLIPLQGADETKHAQLVCAAVGN
jgi:hypothetical protein